MSDSSLHPQQHIDGTTAAVHLSGGAEGLDVVDSLQPLIDDVLQHRTPWSGATTLAVNDANAAHSAGHGLGEEVAHGCLGLSAGHAMQVELGVDDEVAPAQLDQNRFGNMRTAETQLVTGREQRLIARWQQAFLQDLLLIGSGKTRSRRRFGRGGWSALAGVTQTAYVAHRLPKGLAVMIPIVVHPSLQRSSMKSMRHFQYSSAPLTFMNS